MILNDDDWNEFPIKCESFMQKETNLHKQDVLVEVM